MQANLLRWIKKAPKFHPKVVNDAYLLSKGCLVIKVHNQAEAIRVYKYPYDALEEILCNAVFHKTWDNRNPIEVRINIDSIEVFNIEGPMPPLTQDDMKKERVASRNYRNRRIGDFLKELHYTEGRSTGFPKIRKALRQNGSPEVRFETDDNNSYFLAHLDIHPEFLKELEAGTTPQATPKDTPKAAPKALDLLRVLKQGPKTRSEMMESMSLKDRKSLRENYINPALEANYIAMQYPDSPKHPNQKYYLTDLGKSLLGHQSKA